MNKALKGEEEAVVDLVNQLKPLILSYSKRYGARQGREEDMYQEGVLEILEALRDFDPSRKIPFLAYVSTRIRHYYHNKRRKNKQYYSLDASVGAAETGTLLDILQDNTCDIEKICIENQEKRFLQNAMEQLSNCQRDIVIRYYFQYQSLKEIAAHKGIHPVSVAKTKAVALKKLGKYLRKVY